MQNAGYGLISFLFCAQIVVISAKAVIQQAHFKLPTQLGKTQCCQAPDCAEPANLANTADWIPTFTGMTVVWR